jgi:hypothetical protein
MLHLTMQLRSAPVGVHVVLPGDSAIRRLPLAPELTRFLQAVEDRVQRPLSNLEPPVAAGRNSLAIS